MIELVPVEVFNESGNELPVYAQEGDSGMDVRAKHCVTLRPKETNLIPTGLFVAIPEGFEIQVRPRSGMSLKTSLRIANTPGTVDSCYRGEICIIAQNTHSSLDFTIAAGERVAQLVLQRVPKIMWVPVKSKDRLGDTERGTGGFGSSGVL